LLRSEVVYGFYFLSDPVRRRILDLLAGREDTTARSGAGRNARVTSSPSHAGWSAVVEAASPT
jgi:hypothetical protein